VDAGCGAYLVAFVLPFGDEHVDAHSHEQSDRGVVGCVADAVAQDMADAKADQRHQHLEACEDQTDAEPILAGQAGHADRR
jgi:hypothetical protein